MTSQHETIWRQLARLDDYARGQNGIARSQATDSPIGGAVWFSSDARQSGDRPGDLAEGWCRLARLRQEVLAHGQADADFVRQAVGDSQFGRLYRFILTEYWGYSIPAAAAC